MRLGDYYLNIRAGLQDDQRFVSIDGLKDLEPGLVQEVGHEHAGKDLVPNHKNHHPGVSSRHTSFNRQTILKKLERHWLQFGACPL